MDNPIDHSIDLGFVNYVKHPNNNNYVVFRFRDKKRADSFLMELKNNKIWFEKSTNESRGVLYHLFGIHKNDFNKAQKINYKVEALHKKKIIPGKFFRLFILVFGLGSLTLAIIGYLLS